MILGGRIKEVSGKKNSNDQVKELSINITTDDVRVNDNMIEIDYEYEANYGDSVGNIVIKGTIVTQESKKDATRIEDEWKKNKRIPNDYAESILNMINYTGSANGTLVARVLNITAPLIPPKIQLKESR